MNWFIYALNNPHTFIDPTGTDSKLRDIRGLPASNSNITVNNLGSRMKDLRTGKFKPAQAMSPIDKFARAVYVYSMAGGNSLDLKELISTSMDGVKAQVEASGVTSSDPDTQMRILKGIAASQILESEAQMVKEGTEKGLMAIGLLETAGATAELTMGLMAENNAAIQMVREITESSADDIIFSLSDDSTTVFRVEGAPNSRITIGQNGQVSIQGDKTLFLNFGDKARAEEFLAKRLGQGMTDAQIKTFKVPNSFVDELLNSAVPESMSKQFPDNPIIVDTTKAINQLGLRGDSLNKLSDVIIQGSGN